MKGKRFKEEQIVQILKEADAGGNVSAVCRRYNVSEQTLYRWRRKYADMGSAEIARLRVLEQENSELKKMVAEQALDIRMLKHIVEKK
jgi:putative transposase